MRTIVTVSGNIGYRHQLDRVRRFLDRFEGPNANDVEFQDIAWSFFQHCWHLKDWVRNDPLASDAQKTAIIDQVHASAVLKICRDLCNGTKHLGLDRRPGSGSGAAHDHVAITIVPGGSSTIDCIVQDGFGNPTSGKQLARDCVKDWERILQSQQLNTTRLS
jgi:hypothetical protein